MKNSSFNALLIAACSSTLVMAQTPPAPPIAAVPLSAAPAAASTASGAISQFNYGPDGRATSFLIAPNTLVSLPPDWAMQMEMSAKIGEQAKASGPATTSPSGMQIIHAQSLSLAGKTLTLTAPSQPAPYAGSGVLRALNYGAEGEINGFVLQNGVVAMTPPMGSSDVSIVKPGANIAISGFAQSTPSGKTMVQVQSITVNGQTIAMNMAPAGGLQPRPDRPGVGRGPAPPPRGAAPPPPPAPPAGGEASPPPPSR